VWKGTELWVCDVVVVLVYWEDVMVYHDAVLLLLQVWREVCVVTTMESSLVSDTHTHTHITCVND